MPPLLWAAVRFEFRGAAIALAILTLIAAVFTISGANQFIGTPDTQRDKQIMLQLFLAISAFSALVVAAISRQHHLATVTSRQSEHELSQLVDMVPSHLWRLKPDGEPTFFNRRMIDFLGFEVADIARPGMSTLAAFVERAVHPEDAKKMSMALNQSLATGELFAMRYRLRRADGVYRWMSSRAEPMRDAAGHAVQWYGLCHDIDDQMRAEETLRASERQLQQLVDAVPVRIWSMKAEGGSVYFNKRYKDHFRSVLADFDDLADPGIADLLQKLVHPEDAPGVQSRLSNCFETGSDATLRFRWREKDDVYRWVECRVEPRRDQKGAIAEWYGVSLDVDDEVRAQDALRDQERELSQLVDFVPVLIGRMAPNGEPTFLSKRALNAIGLDDVAARDEPDISRLAALIGATVHPEDGPRMKEVMSRAFAAGEPYTIQYRRRRADGVFRWMEGRAEPVRDQSGAITQWYSASLDIDDQIRGEEAVRQSEQQLKRLTDAVPAMIWCATREGTLSYINKRLTDVVGVTLADLTAPDGSRSLVDVHPDDRVTVEQALARSFESGAPFAQTYRQRRVDGSYRWTEGRAEAQRDETGAIVQWYGVCVDVDDRVRLYGELAEREARIRRLVDSDIIGIVIWDLDGTLLDANDAFLRMVGYTREEMSAGLDWLAMTPPEWQEVHAREEAEELARTGKMQAREKEYFRKDGSRVPILIGGACFEGQSRQGVAYILDLTESKRAEAALRERERFLWQLVETLPAMIDCAAPNGEPVYRSRQLREFLGYNLEELDESGKSRLAGTLDAGVHPDDVAGVKEKYAHSLSTGEPYARRHRLRRFDGEYLWVETRAAPMRDADGTIVQWNVICLDIDSEVRIQDELRLSQDRLARASQAASLAELSAAIAHEVNQPLAAIVANSHACHRWLSAEPPNVVRAKSTAERIIRDANSAAEVVGRIRALFKQSTEARSTSRIDAVIAEACTLMATESARRRVAIRTELDASLPAAAFDRVQVQQVLVNLMRNGVEAMDGREGSRTLLVRAKGEGDEIKVEVIDSGGGIDNPDHIFEPFFTTKESGMGMGLAISRSIIEAHGGRLWADGNAMNGATFTFTLPANRKATA
jgi:PAS domain S-box-containing protein